MARAMVTKYGMSDKMGVMVYEDENQNGFFGNVGSRTISEATQQQVDQEVRRILDEQYKVARDILENNKDIAHAMVKALMEWETIDRDQIRDIMEVANLNHLKFILLKIRYLRLSHQKMVHLLRRHYQR